MTDTSEPTEIPPTMLKKCFEKRAKHGLSFRTRSCSTFSEIVDIKLPTKTILCTYGRMARLYVPIRNKIGIYLRPFTISELLQIQDFPRDYDIKGNYNCNPVISSKSSFMVTPSTTSPNATVPATSVRIELV